MVKETLPRAAFATRLEELISDRGVKREEVAQRAHTSHQAISLWITQKREPLLHSLASLADAFEVSLDYLSGHRSAEDTATYPAKDETTFSKRLRNLMDARGASKGTVGIYTGTTDEAVSLWLAGARQPNLLNLWRLADYFNCTIDYLIGRADEA